MGDVAWFDKQYADVLLRIMQESPTLNERTGKRVKQVHGVYLATGPDQFPLLNLRNINPMWSCVEAVWFMSGSNDPEFMASFGLHAWDKFRDEEGFVESATGHRWSKAFDVDQLLEVMIRLVEDPTTRQAVMVSWLPKVDLKPGRPNVPCIVAWHFEIMGGRLHMSVFQRSADMYFGFPHDILGFRVVQELMAAKLVVPPGCVNYYIANAHLYEDQWLAAEEMLLRSRVKQDHVARPFSLTLHAEMFRWARQGDKNLPGKLAMQIDRWYRPWEPIKGPRLVL